jgi:hypothetical protein
MKMAFPLLRRRSAHTSAHVEPARVPVNVTAKQGEREPSRSIIDNRYRDQPATIEPDLSGFGAATDYIRANLPQRPAITPERAAASLRQHNMFRHGNGPMGSPTELTLALDYAANVMERMA